MQPAEDLDPEITLNPVQIERIHIQRRRADEAKRKAAEARAREKKAKGGGTGNVGALAKLGLSIQQRASDLRNAALSTMRSRSAIDLHKIDHEIGRGNERVHMAL